MSLVKNIYILIFSMILTINCYAEKYTIVTGQWTQISDSEEKSKGAANAIIEKVLKVTGDEVDFKFVPWPRALEILKKDQRYIASSMWSINDNNIYFYEFSDNFFQNNEVLFYLKSNSLNSNEAKEWKNIQELKPFIFGATENYGHVEFYKKNNLKYEVAHSDEANFKKLLAGRIDFFSCNILVAEFLIEKYFKNQKLEISHSKKVFFSENFALATRRDDQKAKAFIEKFNQNLKKLNLRY